VSPINILLKQPLLRTLNFVFSNSEESVTYPFYILENVYNAKSVFTLRPASLSYSLVQL